jgi:hypothetical protein
MRETVKPLRPNTFLACGHGNRFVDPLPEVGALAWCYSCCEYRRVASRAVGGWGR